MGVEGPLSIKAWMGGYGPLSILLSMGDHGPLRNSAYIAGENVPLRILACMLQCQWISSSNISAQDGRPWSSKHIAWMGDHGHLSILLGWETMVL